MFSLTGWRVCANAGTANSEQDKRVVAHSPRNTFFISILHGFFVFSFFVSSATCEEKGGRPLPPSRHRMADSLSLKTEGPETKRPEPPCQHGQPASFLGPASSKLPAIKLARTLYGLFPATRSACGVVAE